MVKELKLPQGFCDECCYDDNPRPELKCKKIKCCYFVKNECLISNNE